MVDKDNVGCYIQVVPEMTVLLDLREVMGVEKGL